MGSDFPRVTGHVFGSRADGEGPRRRSSASALDYPSTSCHGCLFEGDAICVGEVLRRASPARLRRDDTRSDASNARLLRGRRRETEPRAAPSSLECSILRFARAAAEALWRAGGSETSTEKKDS